jgi:hypothetical protein
MHGRVPIRRTGVDPGREADDITVSGSRFPVLRLSNDTNLEP